MPGSHTRIIVLVFLFIRLLDPCYIHAQSDINTLMQQVEDQKYDTKTVDSLLKFANRYWYKDLDSSLMLGQLALGIAEEMGYQEGVADAHYKQSVAFRRKGEFNDAIDEANQCLAIAGALGDSTLLAKVNYQLGTIYKSLSDKNRALNHYNQALAISLFIKDTVMLSAIHNGLGNYYLNIGAFRASLVNYQKALDYALAQDEEENQGIILGNLGNIYHELDLVSLAEEHFSLAYTIAVRFKNTVEQSNILNRLGSLASDLQEYDKADSLFRLAYNLKLQIKDYKGLNNARVNLGLVCMKRGMFNQALQYLDSALAYYRENGLTEGMITSWQDKGECYLNMNDYSKAYLYYDSSMRLAREAIDLRRTEELYLSLSQVSEKQGNISDALEYFKLFYEMEDSISSIEKNQMLFQLDLMSEKEKRDLEKYIRQEEHNKHLRQRNAYTYIIVGLVVLAIYLIIFFRYRARKNQIIAEQKVKQLEEERKLLAVRFLVEGQEEERKRIATELHDGLGALLSVTKMQFTAIKDVKPENKPHYEKVARFLEQASGDVRKISHNMMPGLLTKFGLYEALEDLFETLNDNEGMDARMEIVGPKERLPENMEIMIYRVIQEIVNNSLKHAGANMIDLTIIVHPDQLDISCSDNGKGFNRDKILEKKTFGIQSIHSRVRFLDGNICIDSSPGNGTVYRINIPVERKQEE